MEIDKPEVDIYVGFYQTERMIMTRCYEIFTYIFVCNCFLKKKNDLSSVEECRNNVGRVAT